MANGMALLKTRASVPLRHLSEPGPDERVLSELIATACRVPDHGNLTPWRILVVRGDARRVLGHVLCRRAHERDPDASQGQLDVYRMLPLMAPLLLVVVSSPRQSKVPEWEQVLSAGALCQNLLLGAHALGFSGQWVTGWPAYDPEVARALGLGGTEKVAGFIYFGTATQMPNERTRPQLQQVAREWMTDERVVGRAAEGELVR